MEAIIISFVYEAVIWTAYALMPHSLWDWEENLVIYGLVVAVIQIIAYLLFDILLPMRDKNSYKKHLCSFIISHIVFTIIIWIIICVGYRKEYVGSNPNYNVPFGGITKIGDLLGGEQGICVLIFSYISTNISVCVGFLLNKIFRRSEE